MHARDRLTCGRDLVAAQNIFGMPIYVRMRTYALAACYLFGAIQHCPHGGYFLAQNLQHAGHAAIHHLFIKFLAIFLLPSCSSVPPASIQAIHRLRRNPIRSEAEGKKGEARQTDRQTHRHLEGNERERRGERQKKVNDVSFNAAMVSFQSSPSLVRCRHAKLQRLVLQLASRGYKLSLSRPRQQVAACMAIARRRQSSRR